jgi:hypothetical protein
MKTTSYGMLCCIFSAPKEEATCSIEISTILQGVITAEKRVIVYQTTYITSQKTNIHSP